jgi:hypothetical protein
MFFSRRAAGAFLLATAALLVSAPVSADDEAGARVTCARAASPGRVRCDVEVHAARGTIRWGDVEIVQTPSFASALKGRVGPRDATAKDDAAWRWAIALVARQAGAGELVVRVRLVVCTGEQCAPRTAVASASVVVGS